MNWETFLKEIKKLDIELTLTQQNQLKEFYKLLIDWNEKINLTRITKEDEVYEKHFYDSITLVKATSLNEKETLLDIGTGAGFPGIVLKICFPHLKITLIDSLLKRVKYLNEVIRILDLKDIEAIHARAEDYQKTGNKFDVVTSRAVAKLPKLLTYALPFINENGEFIAMKATVSDEIKESISYLNKKGYEITKVETFNLPIEKSLRNLVVIKKK